MSSIRSLSFTGSYTKELDIPILEDQSNRSSTSVGWVQETRGASPFVPPSCVPGEFSNLRNAPSAPSPSLARAYERSGFKQTLHALYYSARSSDARKELKTIVNGWAKKEDGSYKSPAHKTVRRRLLRTHKLSRRTVDLSGLNLSDLPDCFAHLPMLKYFIAKENNLTKLPMSLAKSPRLEDVDVSGNNLESLPPELLKLERMPRMEGKHRTIIVKNNPLTSLPVKLQNLQEVQEEDGNYTIWSLGGGNDDSRIMELKWKPNFLPPEHLRIANTSLINSLYTERDLDASSVERGSGSVPTMKYIIRNLMRSEIDKRKRYSDLLYLETITLLPADAGLDSRLSNYSR